MISAVVAAYNGSRFIEEQLESIMSQTRAVDEVIICDDRSTDGTADIVRGFIEKNRLAGWHLYVNPQNLGYCFNFYGAIEKASGDIIFLCDQDDLWRKNKVEEMCRVFENNPEINSLSCRYDVIDADSRVINNPGIPYLGERFDGSIEDISVDSLIACSYIRGFSMAFRRSLVPLIKPLDLTSLLAHDWYINMLAAITGRAATLNTVLNSYRHHDSNVSLSDMSRKTFLGDREKRIKGLTESVAAHSELVSSFGDRLARTDCENIKRQITCEQFRLKFLQSKNPVLLIKLLSYKDCYARYYKFRSWKRVFLGDICYAYNINFRK